MKVVELTRLKGTAIGGDFSGQITTESGKQMIYFSWDQGSSRDIWRTHVRNGTREQVTHGGGGLVGREAADGQSVLYQPKYF
jgi:hypothetical protein